jgi:hypothetical protein
MTARLSLDLGETLRSGGTAFTSRLAYPGCLRMSDTHLAK